MIEKYDEIVPVYESLGNEFIKSLNPIVDAFDQIEKGFDDIALLFSVHDSVRLYGVTEALCSDMAKTMWDKFEFDLEAFKGAKNTSLRYCTEGILSTVKNILITIKNFFDKILKWFLVDSPFRNYLNLMTYYWSYTNKRYYEAKKNIALVDPIVFSKQIICGYSKDRYIVLLNALIDTISVFNKITSLDDLSKVVTTIDQLNQVLASTGINAQPVDGKGVVLQNTDPIGVRSDTMAVLGFTVTDMTSDEIYKPLHDRLLANSRPLINKRFFIIKSIRECDRAIAKCLEKDQVSQEELDNFRRIKMGCAGIKRILKEHMMRSVQLAVQYCRIVDVGLRCLRKTY